jgi:putative sigma-54 modulation protein
MEIKIAVRHGHLDEAAQTEIREKARKLVHSFNRLSMITVTVDLENDLAKSVEFLVSAEHKHDFVARETHPDLTAAFDAAFAKVEHQLRRYKEKIQDHHRGTPHAGSDALGAPADGPDVG